MFAQDESHNAYLDKFFATNPTPAISWIHDLGNGNHEAAATALLKEANHASYSDPRQVSKHALSMQLKPYSYLRLQLMLSIGKLSHLAQLQLEGSATADGSILDGMFPILQVFVLVLTNVQPSTTVWTLSACMKLSYKNSKRSCRIFVGVSLLTIKWTRSPSRELPCCRTGRH